MSERIVLDRAVVERALTLLEMQPGTSEVREDRLALRASLSAGMDGYVLVPREATDAIVEAMARVRCYDYDKDYFGEEEKAEVRDWVRAEYSAAVTAAASPPLPEPAPQGETKREDTWDLVDDALHQWEDAHEIAAWPVEWRDDLVERITLALKPEHDVVSRGPLGPREGVRTEPLPSRSGPLPEPAQQGETKPERDARTGARPADRLAPEGDRTEPSSSRSGPSPAPAQGQDDGNGPYRYQQHDIPKVREATIPKSDGNAPEQDAERGVPKNMKGGDGDRRRSTERTAQDTTTPGGDSAAGAHAGLIAELIAFAGESYTHNVARRAAAALREADAEMGRLRDGLKAVTDFDPLLRMRTRAETAERQRDEAVTLLAHLWSVLPASFAIETSWIERRNDLLAQIKGKP